MARPLRIEYFGAVYHVTARGDARRKIFMDDTDRQQFLSILGSTIGKYNWLCHAYCLMDNHYHLLIETPDPNLSLGMRQLNGVYTQFFNRHHKRPGHVFQGRFKAILVDKESHLLELCRYVVLNPVRARRVEKPEAWQWSSYAATSGLRKSPDFLTTDWILGVFSREKGEAQKQYRQFVKEGLKQRSPWNSLRGQILLGDDGFVQRFKDLLKDKEKVKEIPRKQRYANRPLLRELFEKGKIKTKAARNEIIHQAHMRHGYTLKQIADHLRLHYTTVSKTVKELEERNLYPKT
ncbi:MAG: transposase [Proteobacteria bacterium]|nr:transposase [Pseudomonadota bacterium]